MKYLKSEELKFTNKNDDGTCTYTGDITINNGGNFVYTFRVLPKHAFRYRRYGFIKMVYKIKLI